MKRVLVLLLSVLMLSSMAFSQKNNTVSAYNTWKKGKLDKAKEYIDKAAVNEKTMADPKTWCYRGHIYFDIAISLIPAYKELDSNPLDVAHESYLNCIKFDSKNRWTDEAKSRLPEIAKKYFNFGANGYNDGREMMNEKKDTLTANMIYGIAVKDFNKAYEVYQSIGYTDTLALYYASIAAELSGDYTTAKSKLEQLVELDYPEADIYTTLANIYYEQDGDVEKTIAMYGKGKEKFPLNVNILLSEINIYLKEGEIEKAIAGLVSAVELDPENPTVHFAIGAKYNEIAEDTLRPQEVRESDMKKAVDAYIQALNIKPDYFEPAYNLGAIYVNKASLVISEANALELSKQKEYDALMDEANGFLSEALPYLETALELMPKDVATLASLKEIYTRLKMYDKLKDINERLSE